MINHSRGKEGHPALYEKHYKIIMKNQSVQIQKVEKILYTWVRQLINKTDCYFSSLKIKFHFCIYFCIPNFVFFALKGASPSPNRISWRLTTAFSCVHSIGVWLRCCWIIILNNNGSTFPSVSYTRVIPEVYSEWSRLPLSVSACFLPSPREGTQVPETVSNLPKAVQLGSCKAWIQHRRLFPVIGVLLPSPDSTLAWYSEGWVTGCKTGGW